MNNRTSCPVLLMFFIAVSFKAAPVQAAPGDVSASFDSPCKYPSGLATDGRNLFVADWRDAIIHEVDSSDGRLIWSFDAPTLKPHGLTFAEGKLFVSDDHTGRIYALNAETGIVQSTFEAPEKKATGLAYADGVLFILADGKIYRVLPEDGAILGYYDVPHRACRCLAHDGRYLWVNNRIKDEFYMVEPESGKVLAILDAPGPHAAGIAWLDGNLWNVDFQKRKLSRIVVTDEPMYRLSDTRQARVEHVWTFSNYGPGKVTDLVLNVALPMELPNQKLLSEVEFFGRLRQPGQDPETDVYFPIEPTAKLRDRWDQQCAIFDLYTVPAQTKKILTYAVNAEVSAIRYLIIPEKTGTLQDIPAEIRQKYTVDGSHYRINTPCVQETVRKIVGDEKNTYWIARKIYDFIIDSLEYEMVGGWDVPEVVLKRGSGSCSEYTYTFVALCRAAGLPARYQGSIVVRGDDASVDEAFHRWAQIYLPNYGWVPVDANRGDAKSPADQARGIGELSNRFLITTQGGGDSEYLGWGYNAFSQYKADGYCKVEEEHFGLWEPIKDSDEEEATTNPAAADSGGACR